MVKEALPWEESNSKIYAYPPTPDHCIFLYLNGPISAKKLGEDQFTKKSTCVVVGPQVSKVDVKLERDHRAVMIGFKPGGLYRFLGIPMCELYDDGFDGIDLIGKDINDLIDELSPIAQPEVINQKVQYYLLRKMGHIIDEEAVDHAIRLLKDPITTPSIGYVAKHAGLSIRQFERKCHERLGMPPKLFSRIARFSQAYRLYEANQQQKWTDITYQCGYFDQMHLIRDFKAFMGTTPKTISRELAHSKLSFQAPLLA